MNSKKILRIVGVVIYYFILGHLITLWVFEKNTTIVNIVLGCYCGNLIIHVIKYIFDRKMVKNIKGMFYYLTQSHKERYDCLLQGDIERAEKFEEIIKDVSDTILEVGPDMIKLKSITKKERQDIQEIIDKTKVLITTIQHTE